MIFDRGKDGRKLWPPTRIHSIGDKSDVDLTPAKTRWRCNRRIRVWTYCAATCLYFFDLKERNDACKAVISQIIYNFIASGCKVVGWVR